MSAHLTDRAMRRRLLLAALVLFEGSARLCGSNFSDPSGPPPAPSSMELYSHGNPTAQEQLMLEYINRARANPPQEGFRLVHTTNPDVRAAYESPNLMVNLAQVSADFSNYPARPPLAFNPALIASARGHSLAMATNNYQGHTITNGTNVSVLTDRVHIAGYVGWTNLAENIYAFARSVFYGHAGLTVDWGVPSLGHRRNLLNFDENLFREIGIGIISETNPASSVGPLVITQDLATRPGENFLVGVVYRDDNQDGFYNAGEGVSGVTILPDQGGYYAVTSASGGYAIPLPPDSGWVTVTASGGSVSNLLTKTVLAGGANVKLDFEVIADTQRIPPRILLPNRTNGASLRIMAVAGQRLVIQGSTNLLQWVNLKTNTYNGSPVNFTDAKATNHVRRFYRVLVMD